MKRTMTLGLIPFMFVSQLSMAELSDKQLRERMSDKYKVKVSESYRKFQQLRKEHRLGFESCKLAVESVQAGDPYLGSYAWFCYQNNEYPGDVEYMEAVGWLKLCYEKAYDSSCAKYLGDLYSNGFGHILRNVRIRPDYEQAVIYYENTLRWSYIENSSTPKNSQWLKPVEERLKKLKRELSCTDLSTRLFGIYIKCAKRQDVEAALAAMGVVKPIRVEKHGGGTDVFYDVSDMLGYSGAKLEINYSRRNILAIAQYQLPWDRKSRKPEELRYLRALLVGLVKKYGPDESGMQTRKKVDIDYSPSRWGLSDAVSITYSSRGYDVKVTYFGGIDVSWYFWEMKHSQTKKQLQRKRKAAKPEEPAITINPAVY